MSIFFLFGNGRAEFKFSTAESVIVKRLMQNTWNSSKETWNGRWI